MYAYDNAYDNAYDRNIIIKFADDTTVIGQISDDDESAYRDDAKHLVRWCASNDLFLNASKTKEIVVDFRKSKSVPSTLIYIIIRDCTRVGAFPRAFCVPNSVALASLTLQVVYWAIH